MTLVLSTPGSKQGTHSQKYEDDVTFCSIVKSTCALAFLFYW